LISALADVDMRLGAAAWLGDLGAQRAVPALVQNLRVRDDLDRNSAVIALRDIGDRSAVPPLLELAQEDEAAGVRASAIDAVATLGDERGVKMLIQLAVDPTNLLATCSRNLDLDLPVVAKAHRGDLGRYSRWATKRLCELHVVEAVPNLEAALPSVDPRTRLRLRRAIRRLRE
jgi:HEAT repeat protein